MVQLKFRSSWKQRVNRYRAIILVVATILIMAIAAGIVGYKLDWTGFNGNNKSSKTLWDWMQLLIIPVALALIAFWFNRVERSNEQAITTDNQQETALQAYLDTMSELLLNTTVALVWRQVVLEPL